MRQKGYVFSIFVFMFFLVVFIAAVANLKSEYVLQESNYGSIASMKASSVWKNIEDVIYTPGVNCTKAKTAINSAKMPFSIEIACGAKPNISVNSQDCSFIFGANQSRCGCALAFTDATCGSGASQVYCEAHSDGCGGMVDCETCPIGTPCVAGLCIPPAATCPNDVCAVGENCPADVSGCADNVCYTPTCTNGCGQTAIANGLTDTGCLAPNYCNGAGLCIPPAATCPNDVCAVGENCPADVSGCADNVCYTPTCTNGCGQTAIANGLTDTGCMAPNYCNGAGACIACTPTFTLLGGGDHCGLDWVISSNTIISGVHTNVGLFKVNSGVTATVNSKKDSGTGSLEVQAQNITILGSINADAAGNLGGKGGNGGPGRHNGAEQKAQSCAGSSGVAGGGANGGATGSGGTYARVNTAESGTAGTGGGNGAYGLDNNANDNIWLGSGGGGGGGGGGGRGETCNELGSSGGGGGAGANAGGAIKLIASNNLIVSGSLLSRGSSSAGNGGGGKNGGDPSTLGFSQCPTWDSPAGGGGGNPIDSGTRVGGAGGSTTHSGGTGGTGGTGSGGGILVKGKSINLSGGVINVYGGSSAANQGNIKIRYSCAYTSGTYTGNAYAPIVYTTC